METDPEEAHLAKLQSQLEAPASVKPLGHDSPAPLSAIPSTSTTPSHQPQHHHLPTATASSNSAATILAASPLPPAASVLMTSYGRSPASLPPLGLPQHSPLVSYQPFQNVATPAGLPPLTPITPHSVDAGIEPKLQNIVSTVNLDCKLNLKKIALHARNAEYNPKRFAAVIMRIREPRTTALIFSSGKMVCTGAKSEEESKIAARKYARIVQKLGFKVKFQDFKIQNMVGSCDVKFPIRLEGLVLTHSQFSSYEPELFPGLIYRMVKPRIVLLIFVSGKVVLTGAKVKQEILEAFENIYPILKGFRKH